MRPIGADKCVRFGDLCLNCSREVPLEVVDGGIFDSFFRYNFRSKLVSDVAVEVVGADVAVKLRDSRSNRSRDIRVSHFVMGKDERTIAERQTTTPADAGHHLRQDRSPKNRIIKHLL